MSSQISQHAGASRPGLAWPVLVLLAVAFLSIGQSCVSTLVNVNSDTGTSDASVVPVATDADQDGITDAQDNCPTLANLDQDDTDGDGVGDACDQFPGSDDNADSDSDGVPDSHDYCPSDPSKIAPGLCGCGTAETNCSVAAGSGITQIVLNGTSIAVSGDGVTVDGTTATLTSARTYRITGSLTNGRIIVDTAEQGLVQVILNGVNISSASASPLYIKSAAQAAVVLADQSSNSLSDPASYVLENGVADEPDAALFSRSLLSISGSGSLVVNGNYRDGISSEAGVIIAGGTITVNSVDEGIRGQDYLVVYSGTLTVRAGGDGLKSDNADNAGLGYVTIKNGTIQVTSGGDAITAETRVDITKGQFTLVAGGGSNVVITDDLSAKGIKGLSSVVIDGGNFTINAADDAIHSNSSITLNGGQFTMATGDDGVHSDGSVTINGGVILITKCYEGIEGMVITINDGTIHLTSSDDGLNGAGDVAGTGYYLYLNGGYIVVNAAGDGIDVNGSIVMTGGTVLVNGPTAFDNGALDYDVSCNVSGGFLLAAGSAGMAQAPSTTSAQRSVLITFRNTKAAGSLVSIQQSGTSLVTFAPAKAYQSVAFSSADLVQGSTYNVYVGGSATGTVSDGLYSGGTYAPGTLSATFTISGAVTRVSAN